MSLDPPVPGGFRLYDRVLFEASIGDSPYISPYEGLVVAVRGAFHARDGWRYTVEVYEPLHGQRFPFDPRALRRANPGVPQQRKGG